MPAKKVKKLAPRPVAAAEEKPEPVSAATPKPCPDAARPNQDAPGSAAGGEKGRGRRQGKNRGKSEAKPDAKAKTAVKKSASQDVVGEERIHASTGKNKYRKQQKGRNRGVATRETRCLRRLRAEGDDRGRLTARQIEAARRAMTRHISAAGAFSYAFSRTSRLDEAAEVRMGNGKGNRSISSPRSAGKVLYEMDGVDEPMAREAFALAAAKLPLRTIFVFRQMGG